MGYTPDFHFHQISAKSELVCHFVSSYCIELARICLKFMTRNDTEASIIVDDIFPYFITFCCQSCYIRVLRIVLISCYDIYNNNTRQTNAINIENSPNIYRMWRTAFVRDVGRAICRIAMLQETRNTNQNYSYYYFGFSMGIK